MTRFRSTRTSTSAPVPVPAALAATLAFPSSAHAIHILRRVILRVGTITDYLMLKLH